MPWLPSKAVRSNVHKGNVFCFTKTNVVSIHPFSQAQNLTDMLDNMGIKEGLHIPGLYPTAMDVQLGTFVNSELVVNMWV